MSAADSARSAGDQTGNQHSNHCTDDNELDMDLRECTRNCRWPHNKSHDRRYGKKQHGCEHELKRAVEDQCATVQLWCRGHISLAPNNKQSGPVVNAWVFTKPQHPPCLCSRPVQ